MVAKDGLPFSVFCTSADLRRAISALHLKDDLPRSPSTIRSIVMKFSQSLRAQQWKKIQENVKAGTKLCAIFDEWTSRKNRRYMYIIVTGS